MGQNKAQREAAARAKKATQAATQTAEAERTRVGSDNPAAIQEKMDAATAQPKADGKAEQPTAAPAKPEAVSKQQLAIEKLKAGWTAKGLNLDKLTIRDDGKYKLLVVDAGWPTVQVGNSGGVTVLELKSYPDAFTASMEGLERYTKQQAREQKKTVAAQPATASQKAPAEKAEKQLATA